MSLIWDFIDSINRYIFRYDSIRFDSPLGLINYLVIAQNKEHSCLFNSFIKDQII